MKLRIIYLDWAMDIDSWPDGGCQNTCFEKMVCIFYLLMARRTFSIYIHFNLPKSTPS